MPIGSSKIALMKNGFTAVAATGGDTTTNYTASGVDYTSHRFTTVGTATFSVTSPGSEGTVDVMVVGGGGAGGSSTGTYGAAGGGGGGGGRAITDFAVTAQDYEIIVGDGGSWTAEGVDSSGLTYSGTGGGYGRNQSTAGNGGSGGGGGQGHGGGEGNAGSFTPVEGYDGSGGSGSETGTQAGNAGGWGGTSPYDGVQNAYFNGTNTYYAGGGGGAGHADGGGGGGGGGQGGGGRGGGGRWSGLPPIDGTDGLGGGSGGGDAYNNTATTGGSGVVIIRYRTS